MPLGKSPRLVVLEIPSGFETQYGRMDRYLRRVENYENGVRPEDIRDGDMCIDDIFTFFVYAYHLKDWIGHDKNLSKKSPREKNRELENYINSKPCLRLCADICNGIKHLQLTRPRSGSRPPQHKNIEVRTDPNGRIRIVGMIENGGQSITALQLGKECQKAWDDFRPTIESWRGAP